MTEVPSKLKEIAEQVQDGEVVTGHSVRQLLQWFEAERRGRRIVRHIRRALKEVEVRTDPDFEQVYLDGMVTFKPLTPVAEDERESEEEENEASEELDGISISDPTYRIRRLPSANRTPISVVPDDTVEKAVTLMMTNDFSQLPVMQSDREVKGMVTWSSIASRLSVGSQCEIVRHCMVDAFEISDGVSLLSAIEGIARNEYALVRGPDKRITGIITTTDLSLQFRQLAEPFLLLNEVEDHLRSILQSHFEVGELAEARDPSDEDREVESVFDLTFGEYVRLLEKPDNWSRLTLRVDRGVFVEQLDDVRQIRNDVMHFDPDGIGEDQLEALRRFVLFLQELRTLGLVTDE